MYQWDPRSMLSRLLYHIPIHEWFPLRHDFPAFDSFVPKILNVTHSSGVKGILSHISDNRIHIRQLDGSLTAHTDAVITHSPHRVTVGQQIVLRKNNSRYQGIVTGTQMGSANDTIDIITKDEAENWQSMVVQLSDIDKQPL